jgi:signal transduction histidine kinase
MATPQMRVQPIERPRRREERLTPVRARASLRLLTATRSEEILPILLEEILALGYPRALAAVANLERAQLQPEVALNCNRQFLQHFRASLYAADNPIISALHGLEPVVLPRAAWHPRPLYIHPFLFKSADPCWEAGRDADSACVARENYRHALPLRLREQTCGQCSMRGFVAAVVVDLGGRRQQRDTTQLRGLIELAALYFYRRFKVEHYYNRMMEMETTIGQMQTVMGSMADPVILTDTQHRVIVQNKAAERFFSLSENVSEGRVRAVELNNMLFSAALSSMLVAGGENSRDLTLVDSIEGEERLFEAVSAPTFNRDGMRTGMVSVMRDVTDLRRADQEVRTNYDKLRAAEETVRQDRDRLNLIIENVGDPIVVCDSAARVILCDALGMELLGKDEEEEERTPAQVKNRARFDAYITAFTFSFSDRESGVLRLYSPTVQAEIEYDARSGKIYDERGQVAYTVTIMRDLTALRRVEQLKVERRMLEMEKFAATGRLAGTIAHEVNNPMEAIKNAIFLLAESVKPEAEPVYNILKVETERVARIVRQMLGLYRTSEQVGSVDVNSVIEDTLLLFARQLERSEIKVETRLARLPVAVGSADQLRQVLSNLVVNARDSMSQGGKLIIRSALRTDRGGVRSWIRILVADTGSGIPAALEPNVFEPFVTTKGERGTGLGLWIVKGIVENHGGRIRVRSREGKGTIFKIDLPVVR